jgi:hypothetical protein
MCTADRDDTSGVSAPPQLWPIGSDDPGAFSMSSEELESEALKLPASQRARLAARLLHRLEALSDEENAQLWAEEASRRDDLSDDGPARPAADVLGWAAVKRPGQQRR